MALHLAGRDPGLRRGRLYVKARRDGRVVSVAVIVAVGVNGDGRREVLGLAVGASEAETFWTDFLRKLARRGLPADQGLDAGAKIRAQIDARLEMQQELPAQFLVEATYVGIDVSKDSLDVHVLPQVQAFAVARDGKGLAELVERLKPLGCTTIAVEATGGFETVVTAAEELLPL